MSSEPTYTTPSATAGALTTKPPVSKLHSDASSAGAGSGSGSVGVPVPIPSIRAVIISGGRHANSPKPNCMAAASAAGSASGVSEATRAVMSTPSSKSRTHSSDSGGIPGSCALKDAMNSSEAVSRERQPKMVVSQGWVWLGSISGVSRAVARRSAPSSLLIHACSDSLSASMRSPQRISGLNSRAGSSGAASGVAVATGARVGAGVGSGAAVGGRGVGAVVLVGAGVLVGDSVGSGCSSPQAATSATASRPANTTNAKRLIECLIRPSVHSANG